jgi:hypothetical protein
MPTVRLIIPALTVLLALVPPSRACSICGESLRTRQTLRMHHSTASVVLHGQLKNPRFDPKTDNGVTDFHITTVLKDDAARGGRMMLSVPRYLPVIGNTPPDYLFFGTSTNGTLDLSFGVPASQAVVEYLKAAAALGDKDPAKKLGFFFKHLDSTDPTIATDSFVEFARASDAEILKAAGHFDAAKLRKLIDDPNTPTDRLGVFALLLGACGGPAEASFLAERLKAVAPSERTSAAFGGLLAGYVLLAPKDAWPFAVAVLGDEKRSYSQRLAAVGTVRFFQATRPAECRAEVLRCCAALLPHADLADQAIEDLRRWGWWDLTPDVLAQFAKPSHAAPFVRRCIVRYAISCPNPEAKAFVDAVRKTDPKLVKDVEDAMALYEPIRPAKK